MLQPRVHTYRAAETGLLVNSYLIEGDEGVLVVDTNLLVSDIEALRARLDALKKPLTGVVVTHAHPDHFNGVFGLVKDREVPVYAAHSVARVIQEIAEAKRAQWSPTYGEEWPAETYYPNTLVADGEPIRFEGTAVSLHEVGPAESHADSYLLVRFPGGYPVAFIGDLAFHGTHPFTADGHSGAWLAALNVLSDRLAEVRVLYPGHGEPAGPQVLADQRRYLLYYREMVYRLAEGEPELSEAAKQELDRSLQAYLPGAPLTWMVGLGADAVAAELASEARLVSR
jgi:glyoxylase-like metal-dependent hydrolase (beta-lactamase superfamily II)